MNEMSVLWKNNGACILSLVHNLQDSPINLNDFIPSVFQLFIPVIVVKEKRIHRSKMKNKRPNSSSKGRWWCKFANCSSSSRWWRCFSVRPRPGSVSPLSTSQRAVLLAVSQITHCRRVLDFLASCFSHLCTLGASSVHLQLSINGCCCCLRWLSASGWALCCLNRVSGAKAVICSVNNRSAAWKTCSSSSWPHTPSGKINTVQPQLALFFPFSRFAFVCVWII